MPSDWPVEREDENGSIDMAIFSGPDARQCTIRYADREYNHFAEVGYPPYARP